jgi:hypothetical protein
MTKKITAVVLWVMVALVAELQAQDVRPWHIPELSFRVQIEIAANAQLPAGLPIEMHIDFAEVLKRGSVTPANLTRPCLRMVEVDENGARLADVPCQFEPSPGQAIQGELVWLLEREAAAGKT